MFYIKRVSLKDTSMSTFSHIYNIPNTCIVMYNNLKSFPKTEIHIK